MERLPQPPDGSRFTLTHDAEGRPRLAWPSLGRDHPYWGGVIFLTLWLCIWVACEVLGTLTLLGMTLGWGPMAGRDRNPPLLFLAAWLGLWTIGGFVAWRTWLILVFTPRTESITFGDGELTYRPGLSPQFVTGVKYSGSLSESAPARALTVRREQVVAGLRLTEIGPRKRLSLDRGADRVELAAGLTHEEREWLCAALLRWAGWAPDGGQPP